MSDDAFYRCNHIVGLYLPRNLLMDRVRVERNLWVRWDDVEGTHRFGLGDSLPLWRISKGIANTNTLIRVYGTNEHKKYGGRVVGSRRSRTVTHLLFPAICFIVN